MAAYFALFILSVISLEAAASQNVLRLYVPGTPTQVRAKPDQTEPIKCGLELFGSHCEDCHTKKFCAGSESPVATASCRKLDSSKPFCLKGECSDKKDPNANECDVPPPVDEVDFKCTFNGYAPDPDDCRVYYYCKQGDKATRYECPINYTYDHSKKSCKQQKSLADCALMKCTPGKKFIQYALDKSIYGVCDDKDKLTVFQCTDVQNEQFNEKIASCGVTCRREGPFADRSNCRNFYTCYKVDGKWDLTHHNCPPETHFDKLKLQCVPGKCV